VEQILSVYWSPATIGLIVGSLVIIFVAFSILKYVKRKLRKWVYTAIGSGKTLLIGTLLFGGGESVPAFFQSTPIAFQQTINAADFDVDYGDNRLTFENDDDVHGYVEHKDRNVVLFVQTNIEAPESVQSLRQLAQSFAPTAKVDAKIDELVRTKVNKRVSFAGGYLELKGNVLSFQVEKPYYLGTE